MRIGIDASRLGSTATGVGRYTEALLEPLDKLLPNATFILYMRSECVVSLPSTRWSVHVDPSPLWRRLPIIYWIHYRLGVISRADELDVLWAPNMLLPMAGSASVPCVTTVCDFCHDINPWNLPWVSRFGPRWWFDADTLRSSKVVAISHGTSARMEAILGRSADAVAQPSAPKLRPSLDREASVRALALLGIRQPFLLTVGDRPCKNLPGVIRALRMMKARGELSGVDLVMVGVSSWRSRNCFPANLRRAPWAKPVGHVDDDVLAALYRLADGLVFPSFYEGFGMPLVEARAYGCRVIASDSPELREAGGDGAIYVEPTPAAIAEGLAEALARPAPSPECLRHDWVDAARVMASVFRDTVAQRN